MWRDEDQVPGMEPILFLLKDEIPVEAAWEDIGAWKGNCGTLKDERVKNVVLEL